MNDQHAQYLVLVAELCHGAQLGRFPVGIVTETGRQTGIPGGLRPAAGDDEELDDSGYARTMQIDGTVINLEDVLECTICVPGRRS